MAVKDSLFYISPQKCTESGRKEERKEGVKQSLLRNRRGQEYFGKQWRRKRKIPLELKRCRHTPLILVIKKCWSVFWKSSLLHRFFWECQLDFFIPGYKQHSLALNWEYTIHEHYWSRSAVDSNFTISVMYFHLKCQPPLQHYCVRYTVLPNRKIIPQTIFHPVLLTIGNQEGKKTSKSP